MGGLAVQSGLHGRSVSAIDASGGAVAVWTCMKSATQMLSQLSDCAAPTPGTLTSGDGGRTGGMRTSGPRAERRAIMRWRQARGETFRVLRASWALGDASRAHARATAAAVRRPGAAQVASLNRNIKMASVVPKGRTVRARLFARRTRSPMTVVGTTMRNRKNQIGERCVR